MVVPYLLETKTGKRKKKVYNKRSANVENQLLGQLKINITAHK